MVRVIRRGRICIQPRAGRAVIAVAVMHEEVHERAGEKDDERQHAEEVRAMLREEIEQRDGSEPPEHELCNHPSASVVDRCHVRIPLPILGRRTFSRAAREIYA